MTTAHHIQVEGMKGEACVQKVRGALAGVAGVTVDSVKVGSAEIHCKDDALCAKACSAVSDAGFRASEANGDSDKAGIGSAAATGSSTSGSSKSNSGMSDSGMSGSSSSGNSGYGSSGSQSGMNKPNAHQGNADHSSGNKARESDAANTAGQKNRDNK